MKQKGQMQVLILIGIIILVSVAGGVYYLGRSSKSAPSVAQPVPTQAVKTTPSVSESTSSADMTNWKTYTNSTVGYTIKYPQGFEIELIGDRDIIISRIGVPRGGQGGNQPFGFMVLYWRGDKGLPSGDDLPGALAENTTINGFSAVNKKYSTTSQYAKDVFIADKDNKRVIRASIATEGDKGYEESSFKVFNQILSTFKFLL